VTQATGGSIAVPASLATELTNINLEVNTYGGGSTTALSNPLTGGSASYTDLKIANTTSGAFDKQVNLNGGSFGLASGAQPALLSLYTPTSVVALDTLTAGGTPTELGTFTVSSAGVTFNAAAVPEPSAYALGICAFLLFWVLKRRNSIA
jgi:hypothetical protein